jgi:hypothetical protein
MIFGVDKATGRLKRQVEHRSSYRCSKKCRRVEPDQVYVRISNPGSTSYLWSRPESAGRDQTDLAAQCDVSQSKVTRFVRETEVPSFQRFKNLIAEVLSHTVSTGQEPIDRRSYEGTGEGYSSLTNISTISSWYPATVQGTESG